MRKLLFLLSAMFAATAFSQVGIDNAVDCTVTDIDGKSYTLFDLLGKNKYILVDVWSTR